MPFKVLVVKIYVLHHGRIIVSVPSLVLSTALNSFPQMFTQPRLSYMCVVFYSLQSRDARIIVAACYEDKARQILCAVSVTRILRKL